MIFVDTNVFIDILERDAVWYQWSSLHLADCGAGSDIGVSPVVVAELSWGFDELSDLYARLGSFAASVVPLEDRAAFIGGRRFQAFRRTRRADEHRRVLPDFLIGAQAMIDGTSLLTRDPRLYRRYFPELTLITPETHP